MSNKLQSILKQIKVDKESKWNNSAGAFYLFSYVTYLSEKYFYFPLLFLVLHAIIPFFRLEKNSYSENIRILLKTDFGLECKTL